MSDVTHNPNRHDHGYEHTDISAAGVIYFLLGLVVAGVFVHFLVSGIYHFLERQSEARQAPVSPLVTSAAQDTRRLPPEYGGAEGYEKYLKEHFPAPQLEVNERGQLNDIRMNEDRTLETYDWVDQNAGTVRIPIERAMDLIAERGLPVREESAIHLIAPASAKSEKIKGSKK